MPHITQKSGKFITLEGIEGAGKSTALNFIQKFLKQHNVDFITTREPGGTPIAEAIRQLLLTRNSSEDFYPQTELLLMYAARYQHLQHLIAPNLLSGKWVVSDRFADASLAYQGGGRGLPWEAIERLNALLVAPYHPHLTLLLDVAPEVGLLRARKRPQDTDRIEEETIDFFVRVRNAYLHLARKEPDRIKIVDAGLDLASVQLQIADYLSAFLANSA